MRMAQGITIRWWLGATVSLCAAVAFAQDRDFSKVQIKVNKVAGNVYMLEGAGGNIGVSVGEDGIAIVDDQYAPMADKIREALKSVSDKPLRFVINTHYHSDHTGGNEAMHQSAGATIIAHDNVRKRLEDGGVAGNGGSIKVEFSRAAKEALPVVTFDHGVALHLNGEEIQALHAPHGHTDGDSMVYFTKSNVVHMGDDFVTYGFPFIDLQAGGSSAGMIAALEAAIGRLPANVKVIPGHGSISSLDDVRRFIAMLKETRAVVEKGVRAGKTVAQLQKDKVLEPWQKFAGPFISADAFIETLYNDLSGKRDQALLKH